MHRGIGPGSYLEYSANTQALPLNPPVGVTAGETWHFQVWYRDLNPGPTSNFTSSATVAFE